MRSVPDNLVPVTGRQFPGLRRGVQDGLGFRADKTQPRFPGRPFRIRVPLPFRTSDGDPVRVRLHRPETTPVELPGVCEPLPNEVPGPRQEPHGIPSASPASATAALSATLPSGPALPATLADRS